MQRGGTNQQHALPLSSLIQGATRKGKFVFHVINQAVYKHVPKITSLNSFHHFPCELMGISSLFIYFLLYPALNLKKTTETIDLGRINGSMPCV